MEAIGRYELVRRLGAGAFATVWLGHDPELDVPVAIKVLADNWSANLDVRARFLSEARLLRRIAHERIVRVYDVGELPDGRPYFVMDHIAGGSVEDLCGPATRSNRLHPARALRIGAEAARGLHVLHEHGVVHRDVKPGNLLLTARQGPEPHRTDHTGTDHTGTDHTGTDHPVAEHVVIADLGMAKALAASSGLTLTAGTPAYMAPEQAHGADGFDERADVYAAAAVTYTLLTGRPPFAFEGGLASVAARDPSQTPPLVEALVPTPPALDELLAAALAHDPERRPRTALELAERLSVIGATLVSQSSRASPAVESRTLTSPARGSGAGQTRSWGAGAIAGLGAATFLVLMLSTWLTLRLLA